MNRSTAPGIAGIGAAARPRRHAVGTALCSRLSGPAALVGGLAVGLALGWLALPALLYERLEQPLTFDHRLHADQGGLGCADCHGFRADGSFVGIPPTETCAGCHAEAIGETAAEQRLVAGFVAPGREIPWLVYARQPQNVLFSHAPHVVLAQIECRRCHGDHGTSSVLPVYERNRLSTYSRNIWGPRIQGGGPNVGDSMKMSDCSGCHAERGVRDTCLMCHK